MSEPATKEPYYAVIFTSKRKAQEGDGYSEMAAKMDALARAQPGFLGMESVSSVIEDAKPDDDRPWQVRSGITISYWADESSIKTWKSNLEHLLAQKKGKENWYLRYDVRISKVERAYTGGLE
ncbi:putative enzyme [Mycena capillaripes]|nr:putative enzyme [Mycena capillaripes]